MTSGCECAAFCRRARAAGIHPVKAGRIGHLLLLEVMPQAAPGRYKVRFPGCVVAAACWEHTGQPPRDHIAGLQAVVDSPASSVR